MKPTQTRLYLVRYAPPVGAFPGIWKLVRNVLGPHAGPGGRDACHPRPDAARSWSGRSAAVLVGGCPPCRGEGGEYDGRTEIVACGVIERSAARDQVQGRVAGRAVNIFRGEF